MEKAPKDQRRDSILKRMLETPHTPHQSKKMAKKKITKKRVDRIG
jgi:hypothetical protein